MEHENLTNRYDQYIMAGTSIGALMGTKNNNTNPDPLDRKPEYKHWLLGFQDHLDLAIKLHDISDIYTIEHRNSGAYKQFLIDNQGDYDVHQSEKEKEHHTLFAVKLTDHIGKYLKIRDKKKILPSQSKRRRFMYILS